MKKNKIIEIIKFEFKENIKNKWLLIFSITFFIFTLLFSRIGVSDILRTSILLLNLILLIIPLFSLIFGFNTFSESINFQEILISLPIKRKYIYIGKWIGLSLSLSISFILGLIIGLIFQKNNLIYGIKYYILLIIIGVELICIFNSLSFLLVTIFKKKEVSLLFIILSWFSLFILYDIIIINIVTIFNEYPIEKFILILTIFNPIDLARIVVLLKMDIASMMNCSLIIYDKYLENYSSIFCIIILLLWIIILIIIGYRLFEKKDF